MAASEAASFHLRASKAGLSGWTIAALVTAGVAVLPLVSIAMIAMDADGEAWRHLAETVLPGTLARTLILLLGVGLATLVTGVTCAWIVTCYRFPGRGLFEFLLVLPLAMPTYIVAFCYLELFDYAGWVQTAIRDAFGFRSPADYWFPNVRSLSGAILLLSLVLYPYVYITARASFLQQSAAALEVGRTLGCGPWGCFFRLALPLAWPALAAGVALSLMETINDIGAVELLGVPTLTVTIYQTWLQRGSLGGAAQIACAMLLIVFVLFWIERLSRRRRRFHALSGAHRVLPAQRLSLPGQAAAISVCMLPILFGFVLPSAVLIDGAMTQSLREIPDGLLAATRNSVGLALAAALITCMFGLLLAYARRLTPTPTTAGAVRLATIGYAVPGTVLAVGLLSPLAAFDGFVDAQARAWFGTPTGLLLSGSVAALLIAYLCRFLAVAGNAIDAGFRKISPNIDASARTLGRTPSRALLEVLLPILRPALAAAVILVFVDTMKELPATLLLRPFNFETLATKVYLLASLEQFAEASVPALAIVASGLVPVLFLRRLLTGATKLNESGDRRFSAVLT